MIFPSEYVRKSLSFRRFRDLSWQPRLITNRYHKTTIASGLSPPLALPQAQVSRLERYQGNCTNLIQPPRRIIYATIISKQSRSSPATVTNIEQETITAMESPPMSNLSARNGMFRELLLHCQMLIASKSQLQSLVVLIFWRM